MWLLSINDDLHVFFESYLYSSYLKGSSFWTWQRTTFRASNWINLIILNHQVMVIIDLFSEAPHLSVSDTRKLTLSADDADVWATISKNTPAQHADTLLPDSENVPFDPLRRLVTQDPRPQRHWQRQNEISQENSQNLQEPNQGKKLNSTDVHLFKQSPSITNTKTHIKKVESLHLLAFYLWQKVCKKPVFQKLRATWSITRIFLH